MELRVDYIREKQTPYAFPYIMDDLNQFTQSIVLATLDIPPGQKQIIDIHIRNDIKTNMDIRLIGTEEMVDGELVSVAIYGNMVKFVVRGTKEKRSSADLLRMQQEAERQEYKSVAKRKAKEHDCVDSVPLLMEEEYRIANRVRIDDDLREVLYSIGSILNKLEARTAVGETTTQTHNRVILSGAIDVLCEKIRDL